jgi:hypothetical protein
MYLHCVKIVPTIGSQAVMYTSTCGEIYPRVCTSASPYKLTEVTRPASIPIQAI